MILKRNKMIDNLDILKEIKRNNTREHKSGSSIEKRRWANLGTR